VFSGRPAYVWISNQVGNTGMLTGTERRDGTTANPLTIRPFHPDPDHYKPKNVTGAPATSYNLELIDQDFKFPQIWRTNIGVDRKLPGGWTGTGEFIYNRDVNGLYYINANLPASQLNFTGADQRPRWGGVACATGNGPCANRINNALGNAVSTNVVLKNENVGRAWNLALTGEKRFSAGLWFKTAYSYGEAKNTVDPGSIGTGSWTANAQHGDPNNPPLAFSSNSPGHRWYMVGSYSKDFFKIGNTTVSLFWETRTIGNISYTFANDANNDGGSTNDLLYVPRDQSEMNFVPYSNVVGGVTVASFTAAEQAAAWDAYISQDPYLSKLRGQYAERNAFFLPRVTRADFSFSQDFRFDAGGRKHTLQFRWDVDNFTNLLNKDWGVSQRTVSNGRPLTNAGVDTQGRLNYRLLSVNNQLITKTFEQTSSLSDVYRMMFSVKYIF
jgi:hypothetical protein